VPQDFVEAAKWYRMAADQGSTFSQYLLGIMYTEGEGVPEDHVEAYARLNVASARNFYAAFGAKKSLVSKMTKEQIAEAQKRSKEIWAALEERKKSNE